METKGSGQKKTKRVKREEFACPCCGTPTDSGYCRACDLCECGEQDVSAPDRCLVPRRLRVQLDGLREMCARYNDARRLANTASVDDSERLHQAARDIAVMVVGGVEFLTGMRS